MACEIDIATLHDLFDSGELDPHEVRTWCDLWEQEQERQAEEVGTAYADEDEDTD